MRSATAHRGRKAGSRTHVADVHVAARSVCVRVSAASTRADASLQLAHACQGAAVDLIL